jgi:hypothetical protein
MAERGTIGTTPSSGIAGSAKTEGDTWRDAALKEYASVRASLVAEESKLEAGAKHILVEAKEHPKTTIATAAAVALLAGDVATRGKLHEGTFKFLQEANKIPFRKLFASGEEALGELYTNGRRAAQEYTNGRREQGLFGRAELASEKYGTEIDTFLRDKGPRKSFGLGDFQNHEVRSVVNSDAGVKATDIELKVIQARGTILSKNLSAADRDLKDLTEEAKQLKAIATGSAKDIRVSGGAKPSKMLDMVRNAEHELKSAQSETGDGREAKIKTAEENLAKTKKAAEERLLEIEGSDGNSGLIGRVKGIAGDLKEKQTQDATQTQTLLSRAMSYVDDLTTKVEARVKLLTADTPKGETPKHIGQADLQSEIRTQSTEDEAKKIADGERQLQNQEKPVTSYLSYRERFGVDEPKPVQVVSESGGQARAIDARTPAPAAVTEVPARTPATAKPAVRATRVETSVVGDQRSGGAVRPESGARQSGNGRRFEGNGGGQKPGVAPEIEPVVQNRGVAARVEQTAPRIAAKVEEAGSGVTARVAQGDNLTVTAEQAARALPADINVNLQAANSASDAATAAIESFKTAKTNFRGTMRALGKYVEATNNYLQVETNPAAKQKYMAQAVNKLGEMMPAVDKKGEFEFPARIGSSPKAKLQFITQNLDVRLRSLGEDGIIVAQKAVSTDDFMAVTQSQAAKARQAYEGFKAAEAQRPRSGDFQNTIASLQSYARSATNYMQDQLVKGDNVEEDKIVQKAVADLQEMMPPSKDNKPFAFQDGTPSTFSAQLRELRRVLDNRMSGFSRQAREMAARAKPPGS